MQPTNELRFVERTVWQKLKYPNRSAVNVKSTVTVLQQKWVQHHISHPETEASFEWRDVPNVKEESHGRQ